MCYSPSPLEMYFHKSSLVLTHCPPRLQIASIDGFISAEHLSPVSFFNPREEGRKKEELIFRHRTSISQTGIIPRGILAIQESPKHVMAVVTAHQPAHQPQHWNRTGTAGLSCLPNTQWILTAQQKG